jgi:hypothetical protein
MVPPLPACKGPRAFVAALATALVSGGLSLVCLADVRDPGLLGGLYAALVLCHLADGSPPPHPTEERSR